MPAHVRGRRTGERRAARRTPSPPRSRRCSSAGVLGIGCGAACPVCGDRRASRLRQDRHLSLGRLDGGIRRDRARRRGVTYDTSGGARGENDARGAESRGRHATRGRRRGDDAPPSAARTRRRRGRRVARADAPVTFRLVARQRLGARGDRAGHDVHWAAMTSCRCGSGSALIASAP